jgi:RNA polymerase sigma factor (sigma-70 family)
MWADDLQQDAVIAGLAVLPDYDPARGSLSTFLRRRVHGQVVDSLRSLYGRTYRLAMVSLDDEQDRDGDEWEDRHAAYEDPGYQQVEDADAIRRLLRGCDRRCREALALTYGWGLTGVEMAQRWGVTEGRVSQIRIAALRRARGDDK